jgi:diaminohydroxyphosphoribosylaminopyrimidine deaminase/5-amino-6-(5-phosphoribosylamino)uracil reductase
VGDEPGRQDRRRRRAQSLDQRAAARRWALAERAAHDVTLVGSGTVLADDPLLTRRGRDAERPNLRVVLDRRLRTPPGARLFGEAGEVVLYTDSAGASRDPARVSELQAAGAQVVILPAVSPSMVLSELHARGVRSVLVEGGATVAASFVHAGLYDRVAAVCAPKLLGGASAPGPLATALVEDPNEAPRVERLRVRRAGEDLILEGLRSGCSADLFSAVAES